MRKLEFSRWQNTESWYTSTSRFVLFWVQCDSATFAILTSNVLGICCKQPSLYKMRSNVLSSYWTDLVAKPSGFINLSLTTDHSSRFGAIGHHQTWDWNWRPNEEIELLRELGLSAPRQFLSPTCSIVIDKSRPASDGAWTRPVIALCSIFSILYVFHFRTLLAIIAIWILGRKSVWP